MKKKYFYFSLLLLTFSSFSQRISVNTTQTPTQLINSLFNSGVCANISGVTITPGLQGTGINSPYGSYINNGTGNVFSQGMIISTGFAKRAGDTVITTTLSDNLGSGGDADLANAFSISAPAALADVAYVEFDFVPIKNTISFRYFLASEEYQYDKNYPCQFSDAFAFLLKDNAVGVYTNIALVPGTATPVGISTVHPDLTGVTGGGGCAAVNPNYFNGYNQNPPNIDGTNFNGSTKALVASSSVIPGHSYHIKLVIADYGSTSTNRLFDSAVFIEAGSFDLSGYFTDQNAVTLTGSDVSCSSNPLVLNPVSQILHPTYQWFKDGVAIPAPQGTGSNYPIPVGGTGNYSLVVTDSQSGCVDTIPVLFVQVIDAPTVLPQSFCTGATVANLVANGTNIKWYTSLTGGVAISSSTLLSTGTYYASQTVGSCETTRTPTSINIGSINPTFNTVNPICSGTSLAALPTLSTNGVTGSWLPALNNSATTIYTFTPDAGQCASTYQLTITVNPLPIVTATNVSGCNGNAITLVGSPLGGIFSTGSSTYTGASTTYTYSYTNVNGCSATSSVATITVNPLPTVTSSNVTGCAGSAITLVGSPTGGTFSTGSPTYIGASNTYTYTYTDGNGCSATSSLASISVYPIVIPSFTAIAPICHGTSSVPVLPLTSLEGIQGTWSPSVIDPTVSKSYIFNPTFGQCISTYSLTITVVNSFDFVIKSGCVGTNFILEVITNDVFNSTNANFNWSINNTPIGSNSTTFNVNDYINSLQTTQQFPLIFSLNITDGSGCQKNSSVTVTDLFCNIQKGITPNGDNLNDFFDLQNLNVKKINIFNRYGMKVYSKGGYRNEWYGQSDSNQELPDGTYYYVIEFNSDSSTKTGWIYINREH
ncbi:choice-of-anchor L domain-containing protein [Flavobacterium sp.]|uniref:choice-of-anchor L domain-containing protein n=1 Tax=Flavobacterium sp. TaxID=239 RepID=UPI0025D9CBD5|nr:choice-of-anchor L domain-containing protein [Flavobacterium sp.]